MIKGLLYIVCFLFGISAYGQDTIQVSRKYKTVMIFPKPISESIIGSNINFDIDQPTQNGKYSSRIIKLFYSDLVKGKRDFTNLIVITDDGNSYEFTLMLVEKPSKMTWYIKEEDVVSNLNEEREDDKLVLNENESKVIPNKEHYYSDGRNEDLNFYKNIKIDSLDSVKEREVKYDLLYKYDRQEYYRLRCYYMQFDKPIIFRYFERVGDVFLWLKGVYFNRDEIYIQFKIENDESVDLDINFMRFSIATNYKKYSSYQDTEIKPVYRYKVPKKVLGKTENHFVIVFKKFSLNKNKTLKVELDEDYGNRDISFEIEDFKINNPKRF